ncbi:hypothetical protein DLD77_00655 [Chitinophaga alhagiae]|uniref:Thioredoxin domain-containing protein n=1 Tax=Chitinophaga alhagiae TaxID=2203219 RepID=A0ABM6W8S9_9BACT|nr:TlpA disulfide reductase family protein [Chitinophaga alhagiae]AWO00320.1 hypothetical protein DLD77_00655 [Chitinophaga alhagiae]
MKNKKILKGVLITLVLLIVAYVAYSTVRAYTVKAAAEKKLSALPAFVFRGTDGQAVTPAQYAGETLVIYYFNSGCDHCELMTKEIISRHEAFQGVKLLMVSEEKAADIAAFADRYKLAAYDFIRVAGDADKKFYATFGTAMVPSMFIYGKDGRLKEKIAGEVSIDKLLVMIRS